jgi:GT2 family glycosyltransferase
MTSPTLTIGFVPRERFSAAARSLASILQHTPYDYELIVVDNFTPPRYWKEIEDLLGGRENVRIIRTEELLLPGPCKELVIDVAGGELTCLVENDVIVTEGWLGGLIDAIEAYPADVVTPMILEDSEHKMHADANFGFFEFHEGAKGTELTIRPLARTARELSRYKGVTAITVGETHCLLGRTEALRRVKAFSEPLNTREFLDTFLQMRKGGLTIAYQPSSRVVFHAPPPILPDELAFFTAKWDYDHGVWSHQRVLEKWDLVEIPGSLGFIKERWQRVNRLKWFLFTLRVRAPRKALRELRKLVPGRASA